VLIERENENLRQRLRAITLVQQVRNGPERPSNTLLLDSPRRSNSNPLLLHTLSGRSLTRIVEQENNNNGSTTTVNGEKLIANDKNISRTSPGIMNYKATPVGISTTHSVNSSLGADDLHLEDVHINIDPVTSTPKYKDNTINAKDNIITIPSPNNIPDWDNRETHHHHHSHANTSITPQSSSFLVQCARKQCTRAFWIVFILLLCMIGTTIAGFIIADKRRNKD